MEEPTEKQREIYRKFYACPCCLSRDGFSGKASFRGIENPGEELTQVWCNYCCQYIFLEDYYKPKNK